MSTVLIVEDELIPANYFKKVLEKEGYTIAGIATKGAEAISMARQHTPDIILMDIMLRDNISGTEAAIAIKRDYPKVQIIFLTAYAEDQMLEQAMEAKAYAYLVKPYREKEIIMTLKLAVLNMHHESSEPSSRLALLAPYSFDLSTQRLFKENEEVLIGPVAIKLITLLCRHPHSSLSIEYLMQSLWEGEASVQNLRSLIHRIRELTSKDLILNINKLGYKINA
jgi:DNA-binding response OmpR family regulator